MLTLTGTEVSFVVQQLSFVSYNAALKVWQNSQKRCDATQLFLWYLLPLDGLVGNTATLPAGFSNYVVEVPNSVTRSVRGAANIQNIKMTDVKMLSVSRSRSYFNTKRSMFVGVRELGPLIPTAGVYNYSHPRSLG